MWNILLEFFSSQKSVSGEFPTVEKMRAHLDTGCITDLRKTMFNTATNVRIQYGKLGRTESDDTPETKKHEVDNSASIRFRQI